MKNLYKKDDAKFYAELNESIVHHKKNCKSFKSFLNNKKFNTSVNKNNLNKFPYIHVSVFKRYSKNLVSIPNDQIVKKLSSSATSGMPSSIYLDKTALKDQSRMMGNILKNYLGDNRRPMIVYDLKPEKESISEIGARYAAIVGYLRFSNKVFFALKKVNSKIVLDVEGLENFINENNNIIHFGFTYIIFQYLLKQNNLNTIVNSQNNDCLIHIGGWKKLENEKISKENFNKLCEEKINTNIVIDIYGFTELMGINFPDCEFGWKHLPNNVKIIIRDEETRKEVKKGNSGLIQFISPFTKSYAGVSILTDDVGVLNKKKCKCGRETNSFKILGRKKKSEIRGCGDILANKFDDSNSPQKNKILFHNFFDKHIENIEDYIPELKSLHDIPAIVLCKMICKASSYWMNDPKLNTYKQQGLSFLVKWCSEKNLLKLLNESLLGNYTYLDGFQKSSINQYTQIRCNPKGLVSHWVAGNVPLLSMLILVQSIITKNKNIVKLSTQTENTLIHLLEPLNKIKINYLGTTYSGKRILHSLLICSFSRNDINENKLISQAADVKISWGGGNSMDAIKKLPSKTNCHNILFGPKTSFSIVSQDYLEFNNNHKRYFLKMARDISSFEQKACSSPHTIFYKGTQIDDFCSKLSKALDITLEMIPKVNMENEQSHILDAIEMGEFTGKVYKNKNNDWVIIKNDNFMLELPVFSRVIFVKQTNDLKSIYPLIHEEVQTISLGLIGKEKINIANDLSNLGVIRFPDTGLMTNFDNPWDGKLVISELVKFSTLGGPFLK